jgi:hypothetical protein
MALVSIFQTADFDLLSDGVLSQELSYLQHKYHARIDRAITIKGEPDRHFRLDKVDRSVNGKEIVGWWYEEIGGDGKVLIVND